jgi:glycosyltransferase involved in cell wall biosynthesis
MALDESRQHNRASVSAPSGAIQRSYRVSPVDNTLIHNYAYRVLIIAPTPFFVDRGGHVQIYEQARALQKLGNTVELCTYHLGRDMPEIPTFRIPHVGWYTKTDAGPAWGKLYLMCLLFFLAWRETRRFKPDVLHGHGWDGCWIAWALHLLTGVPFIFNMQGSFSGEIAAHGYARPNSLFFKLLRWIERWTLHRGHVVSPSRSMIEGAIRDFGVRPDCIHHTYDGVDVEDLRPGLDSAKLRVELNIPAGRKIVVFLGLLKTYQGVDVLLDAARILVHELKCTNVHFLIMGFPDADKYAAKAHSLGLSDCATFPGRIDYKRRKYYYALGDVAVAPKLSTAEGDGKIYDYLAMGLPIVTFDYPVSKEILSDLAFYAEFGDARSLAEALHRALTDEACAREFGRRGECWPLNVIPGCLLPDA